MNLILSLLLTRDILDVCFNFKKDKECITIFKNHCLPTLENNENIHHYKNV